jgi:hypothetical protein
MNNIKMKILSYDDEVFCVVVSQGVVARVAHCEVSGVEVTVLLPVS